MSVTIEVSQVIHKPKQLVYNILKNVDGFPKFMKDVKAINVIKRPTVNSAVVVWEIDVDGASITSKEDMVFDDTASTVKFNMLEGSYKEYSGSWAVNDHHSGSLLKVKATYDWGIPILEEYVGKTLIKKAKRGLLGMVLAIKKKAEGV